VGVLGAVGVIVGVAVEVGEGFLVRVDVTLSAGSKVSDNGVIVEFTASDSGVVPACSLF
jgi:hypothetical protein